MKKTFIFVCIVLGSCAFIGCNSGATQPGQELVADSVEVVDTASMDTISQDSIVCPD